MHVRVRSIIRFCAATVAVLFVIGACNTAIFSDSVYGSLRLRIVGSLGTQDFAPGNTEITHLRVYGIGPSGRTVDPPPVEVGVSVIVIEELLPGAWVFVIDALNSDGVPVLTGQEDVFIAASEQTTVNITLGPISGNGTLEIEFTWPVESLDVGEASAGLARYEEDAFGVPQPLTPFISSQANGIELQRYEGQHAAGYYRLDTIINDANGSAFSDATTVRIMADLTTVVTIDLETGDVQFSIVLSPQLPLTVALAAVPEGPLSPGADVTVTATVSGGTETYTYRWYLDGQLLAGEISPVIVLGFGLDPGRYRLSLIASDGQVLGSAGVVFDVIP